MSLALQYQAKVCQSVILQIVEEIQSLPSEELSFHVYDVQQSRKALFQNCIAKHCAGLTTENQNRIASEFEGMGPIQTLCEDHEITEILINGHNSIWYEKDGKLGQLDDCFASRFTYQHFVNKICQLANTHYNLEKPMADGKVSDFRLHIISEELTKNEVAISLRRHPKNPWNFRRFAEAGFATTEQIKCLHNMIEGKENFLIIGGTGSGKTSLLNACLQDIKGNERAIIIEDTSEISLPNSISCKLITRKDAQGALPEIDQAELVKQSLRMRPDRLIMGEVRGQEAKDLLMALSTGHSGSFATLHATDARQALLRLEMLIQLGAPYWSLDAIRNLIFLSLQKIVVVERNAQFKRQLSGIYQISSRESSGILVDKLA